MTINKNEIQRSFQRLFQSNKELLVCSPFISPNYLTDLIEISKKNVSVKVITSEGNKVFYRSTLLLIDNFQNTPNFESKIIEKLHAKIYICDNDYAIHGSANLTDAGLKSNIEQISIIEEPNEIIELKKIFDDIWKNGIEKKIDLTSKSKYSTFKISKKEKAITDAKNFIQEKYSACSTKQDLLNKTRDMLRAHHHLGEERLENYHKIVLSDLKLKHNFDLDENNQKEKKYSIKEIQKKYPNAYERWTESDDEFLKKFWKDESNKQSRNEKIQELMQKFGRKRGAIVSRLHKMGFDLDEKYPAS